MADKILITNRKEPVKIPSFSSVSGKRPFFTPIIQPRMKVNMPGDRYEKEADAVADQVMAMSDHEPVFQGNHNDFGVPTSTLNGRNAVKTSVAYSVPSNSIQKDEDEQGPMENLDPVNDAAVESEAGIESGGDVGSDENISENSGSDAGTRTETGNNDIPSPDATPNVTIELPLPMTIRVNGVMYTSPTFLLEGPNGRIVDIAAYTGRGFMDFPLAALEALGIPALSYYHFHFGRARQFLGHHFESAYGLSGGTSFIRNALHYGYITADDVTLFGAPSSFNLEHYGGIPHLNIVANPMDIGTMINVSYFNYPLFEGHNNPAVLFSINAPFDKNPFEAFQNLGGAIYHALSGDLYNLPGVTHSYPRFRNEPDEAIGSPSTRTQVSRKAVVGLPQVSPWIEDQILTSKGGGRRLQEPLRNFMESRIGSDFSRVRIHTDEAAVQMNRDLGAQAFTVGSDIYFNRGRWHPDSTEGRHLLAHELTHVVQQNGSSQQFTTPGIQKNDEDTPAGRRRSAGTIEEELASAQRALAAINEELSTGLFDWGVSETEARRVFAILRRQSPGALLRIIQILRMTNRGRRFYDAFSESDRRLFDDFSDVFATDTGYLAGADTIRIEVYSSSGQTEAEFTLDLQVSSAGVRPFFLSGPIQVMHLLPQQAAQRIARTYRQEQIFVEPRVRLLVTDRGAYYAPRHGATSRSIWFEAIERLSSAEAARMDKRRQFLDYINIVDVSRDPTVVDASLRYLNWISANYTTEEFMERSPHGLWDWALREAMRPLPQSPVQPFLDLYRRMSYRLENAEGEERQVLQASLNRYLDWIDRNMENPRLSSIDPVEIWANAHSRSYMLHLETLRDANFRRVMEESRQQEEERTRAAREQRWQEHFNMAMRLWGYSSRNFPYRIPIPSEGRDILVTGDPARQAVLNALAEQLMDWSTRNMHSSDFLRRSPESVLADLLEGGYGELLAAANTQPLQSESIDRRELIPGRVLASFGETVATGLLAIALVGAAVGAGIITAPVAAVILIGAAGAAGVVSYLERRQEIENEQYDVPIPETMLHSAGDAVGLSQLIEGITGERLGTGRRLESLERSGQLGTGSGGVVLLLTGSKAYRAGQARGQRFRLSRPGETPPGPEGGTVRSPEETPPVELSRPGPSERPGPLETRIRSALDQRIRAGFDEWMAEIRSNGGDPEAVLGRMSARNRMRVSTRRAEDFTEQFLERVRQEQIRIRSMDNPLNPVMRHTEQAIPGNDGVLIMYNRRRPDAHEIEQAIRLFRRTGEPIRLFGDTAGGRNYPGIDGTIGLPPRPLSLKHGAAEAQPNFARFQAEEALISARNNGYTHVEVHIEMQGRNLAEIRTAWDTPPLRPGQTQPRPVFDTRNTVARIVIKGSDGNWVIDPPLEGAALPGVRVPVPVEENE